MKWMKSFWLLGTADVDRCRGYVSDYALTKVNHVLAGGAERQDSVRQGSGRLTSGYGMGAGA